MMAKRDDIAAALASLATGNLPTAARALFGVLGYRSERVLEGQRGNVEDFIEQFSAQTQETKSEERFRENVTAVHILFQVTDDEITNSSQGTLFDTKDFDKGLNKSYLFLTIELNQANYARSQYAAFTREVNKRFPMPAFLLFRAGRGEQSKITLAFIQRRKHKRDEQRHVLGSVSLIRDIAPHRPHRAHLDLLAGLSLAKRLEWMKSHREPVNFDGLLAALLNTLDTQELNKRFYKHLFGWFKQAVDSDKVKVPTDQTRTIPKEEHIIRLITRLLFVWFIKEKGLVAEELFIEERVRSLLKNYDRVRGDSYYRAVLQNLFFATLNTEIQNRGFSTQTQRTHRDFSRYRHQDEIADSGRLLKLFEKTPFINGGLFDCLDSFDATGAGGYRIDCFSDNPDHRHLLSIPNYLFFADDGLVTIFNRYKFTVEENTPIEQDVALDPELLGKVFENLLAAVNPETRKTARKQTGSYYTPRLVVDYMVEEALVASLASKLQPADGDGKFLRDRLHYLLDYEDAFDDAQGLFEDVEAQRIVEAIAKLKVLDPAVGSGAFPMGILHKLTLALQRLDPDNNRWQALQKRMAQDQAAAAFDTSNPQNRDAELQDISTTFERYKGSDFGRKLYLIQNSIFGVDIQTIACQIAKLRFFISLAIEQQPNDDRTNNYGIKPLPNLETRFVAANTLLALAGGEQEVISSPRTQSLEKQLRANRERYFHAKTRDLKLNCQTKDRELRDNLTMELKTIGMGKVDAEKIATWDPYDQNTSTDWFDAGYMFGVTDGFDVVIGNPPYNQLQEDGGKLGNLYKNAGYVTFARTGDIYQLFYERGCQVLHPQQGILAYITSNSWLKAEYGRKTRCYLGENHTPMALLELGKDVFESAIVDSSILVLRHGGNGNAFPAIDLDQVKTTDFPPPSHLWGNVLPKGNAPWGILSVVERGILDKMQNKGTPLKDWDVSINYGIKTGYNQAFIIDNIIKEALISEDARSAEIIKPVLRGRDIQRYRAQWAGQWLIVVKFGSYQTLPEEYPAIYRHLLQYEEKLRLRGQCRYSRSRKSSTNQDYNGQHHWLELDNNPKDNYLNDFTKKKLFWIELSDFGRFCHDEGNLFGEATTFMLTGKSLKFLCAVLNSRLTYWFLRHTAPTSGMGTLRWKKVYVERLPIPKISTARQQPFIKLMDHILSAKATNPAADISALEAKIDRLVYQLYGLTDQEIATVQGSSPSLGEQAP